MTKTRPLTCAGVRRIAWSLLALSLLCSVKPANAEYRLDSGDVIEISVARIPELRQRVTVQLDGSISFPLLGTFVAGGLTPSEFRTRIQVALASKVFRQRTADGRENSTVLEPDEVTANVVEYRPIYVSGNVTRPGEQTYRPKMTVRQAVALSGGYGIAPLRTNDFFLDSVDWRSDYASLWAEFVKEQAHVWRIKAELGDKSDIEQKELSDAPIPQSMIAHIMSIENEQLKIRQADHQREKSFLQHSVKQTEEQIEVLSEQQQKEEQGTKADAEELQRVIELLGKGFLTSPRVTEARRSVLLASTRKLQTTAQLMQVKRQRDDLQRQLEKLDDQRRINLLRDLQDSGVRLSGIQAKLQSIGEKLRRAGTGSQVAGHIHSDPEIMVVRRKGSGRERFSVDQDSELQPGDVVEVTLRTEYVAGLPMQ
jgi:polysaccharide export outer membrane protein